MSQVMMLWLGGGWCPYGGHGETEDLIRREEEGKEEEDKCQSHNNIQLTRQKNRQIRNRQIQKQKQNQKLTRKEEERKQSCLKKEEKIRKKEYNKHKYKVNVKYLI